MSSQQQRYSSYIGFGLQVTALAMSLAVLVFLRLNEVPLQSVILVIFSYLLWFALVQYFRHRYHNPKQQLSCDQGLDGSYDGNADSPQHEYYRALVLSLERNWQQFGVDFSCCDNTVHNAHGALAEAIDAASSTGMLALNAMIAATDTGEVGRGFVTVSKDLVAISEQSIEDLAKVRLIVGKAANGLDGVRQWVERPAQDFMLEVNGFPFEKMDRLGEQLGHCQDSLRALSDRYQKNLKSDVRWLQMGDAVRRLLNELINTLYQLQLRLNDVLSDMRLLKLSGTLSTQQLLEIQDSISTMEAAN